MVALRSRRLEQIFGAPLDALTAAHVHGLVTARAPEMFDLEFKEAHYGRSDSEKRKLAGDVAAMANASGGMILIGIAEDEQGCAAAAPGVDYTEAEKLQIQQVVAAGISPLPTFDVEMIPDESDNPAVPSSEDAGSAPGPEGQPQHGFILIAVLRTTSAPHAALIDDKLRFPVRSGTTTRYLSQPEVAAAYAERFAGAARQADRIAEVERDAFRRLHRESGIWVVVPLVPDVPGDMPITNASFSEFRQQTMQQTALIIPEVVSLNRIRTGRRRFLVDGGSSNSPLAKWVSLELHADGAGTYGVQIPDSTPRSWMQFDPDGSERN